VLFPRGGSLLDQLLRRFVLLLGNAVVRGSEIILGVRYGAGLDEPSIALEFRFGVCEFCRGRALLRFPTELLFGPLTCAERRECGLSPVTLRLNGIQPGAELILPKLGNDCAFANPLSFFDWQFH